VVGLSLVTICHQMTDHGIVITEQWRITTAFWPGHSLFGILEPVILTLRGPNAYPGINLQLYGALF
jgi:hypothetical protein